jgi:UDP-N-acetylmuramoyl-tripeptide--D-alanyl-D-alanine ligase
MIPANIIEHLHQYISRGAQVCTDSRNPIPGSIFFALKGENFDGNLYASEALDKGCALAVIDNPDIYSDPRHILVQHVIDALHLLCQYHRKQWRIPVIGITGSNGKTTTKELTHAVLATKYNTLATRGNLNNHIGVPLTLLSANQSIELAVIEMGANHLNEIDQLCQLADPGFGLITSVGKAHLEGFGSFEQVVKAKSELYRYIHKHQGVLFVNGDNDILFNLAQGTKHITYGRNQDNQCVGYISKSFPGLEVHYKVNTAFGQALAGFQGHVKSMLFGDYNFDNIMAAITIGLYFGVEPAQVESALSSYTPSNNRSQICQTADNLVIVDAYNANPTSMSAAIQNFTHYIDTGHTALFLGDMLELGEYAESEHATIMQMIQDLPFDLVVYVGKHFGDVFQASPNARMFEHVEDACQWLRKTPLKNHTVLLKGSRSLNMEKLLEYL